MKKLEITLALESCGGRLWEKDFVAVLNMPGANVCEKRGEMVRDEDGTLRQACRDCITQRIQLSNRMDADEITETIDWFAGNYDTRIITVNGRGNPFHPMLEEETLFKIRRAAKHGMHAYVFTASDNLDEPLCRELAGLGVNVMISLYGNRFIDAGFFNGKEYAPSEGRMQDQAAIAQRLRTLIRAYQTSPNQPPDGCTRLAMNYVVGESDLKDETKLRGLSEAAAKNDVFFVCNTPFARNRNSDTQQALVKLAHRHTHYGVSHSTAVDGECQMGAGSGVTIDYNGTLYRCPYLSGAGNGNFTKLTDAERRVVVERYLGDRQYACVMRRTLKKGADTTPSQPIITISEGKVLLPIV